MKNTQTISVELFVATGCHHCPSVLNSLSDQLKNGQLSSLCVTNIAVESERADELNVRSVPWFSLLNSNAFMIFSGSYTEKEIQHWLDSAKTDIGMQDYIKECLSTGQLATLIHVIQLKPNMYSHVVTMLGDEETSMDIRIGLDALTENFIASDMLKQFSEDFKKIASTDNLRLQLDALHYIALTADEENIEFLNDRVKNSNIQISQAATEALETLSELIN